MLTIIMRQDLDEDVRDSCIEDGKLVDLSLKLDLLLRVSRLVLLLLDPNGGIPHREKGLDFLDC